MSVFTGDFGLTFKNLQCPPSDDSSHSKRDCLPHFLCLCLQVLNSQTDTLKLAYALASKSTNGPATNEIRRIFDSFVFDPT